jgi:transcription initiation factor TFIIIB Brf1 subunit/transcription initiation factor TFIIB
VIYVDDEETTCPECGSDQIAFGPPSTYGGTRYQINAVYCESCGCVLSVVQWTPKLGVREATLVAAEYEEEEMPECE